MKTAMNIAIRRFWRNFCHESVSGAPIMPIRWLVLILSIGGICPLIQVEASEKISLPLTPQIARADIYIEACMDKARGTLVLCPGHNGNGQDLIENPKWLNFGKDEKLNLVGLSFASNDDPRDQGYFNVSSGSGQLLLDGLKRAFGPKQPPLLLFGFSRGAQFAYSFSRWKPDIVMAWCAYSATEWETPEAGPCEPKGIIACGDEDESNYSFSVLQFLKGRSIAQPWTWVSLAHTGHVVSPRLEDFVRAYFASVLSEPQDKGLWLDVDTKTPISIGDVEEHPTLAAWLPNENVARLWKEIHNP
jgi:hypothetical protein